MSQQQEYWFAARTRKDQELTTRDALEKIGVEYFLPTQFVIRQLKYRRRRVEVPVIRNLIFVHATKEFACAIANEYGVRLFYMRDFDTKSMLIVPDKQMKDFMFVMNLDPAAVILNDDCFAVGTKVQVIKGDFCGVEGELASLSNRTYVTIRIRGVLSASVKVPKSYLRILAPLSLIHIAKLPRQAEWEAYMSRFQRSLPGQASHEKWKMMERIFKL